MIVFSDGVGERFLKSYDELKDLLEQYGQSHLLTHWESLGEDERATLAGQLESVDFELMARLADTWVLNEGAGEHFEVIEPAKVLPPVLTNPEAHGDAFSAGEEALRAGRVGLVLVAGGQGTRLGYDGPKGAFPIAPVSGRTLFEFHAEKIHAVQRRYGCRLPWYIMVGDTNEAATRAFFDDHDHFGLDKNDIVFFRQRMVPCVDGQGKFLLSSRASLAMNPNGHGGSIPALVENGILEDARSRGIDTLSYFQVDNWAAKVADPHFIGHHLLNSGKMSSKTLRKSGLREAAGVFCVCDGKLRIIEYTELDVYPQLLELDGDGAMLHFASNAAIHVLSVHFVQSVYDLFSEFPWHCSHKKVPFLDTAGDLVEPDEPNAYKFETFVFDALQYVEGDSVLLEIPNAGEFTPTKQMTGSGSVEESRRIMSEFWGGWVRAAGCTRDLSGVDVEISPAFALDEGEFVERAKGLEWPETGAICIGPDGAFIS